MSQERSLRFIHRSIFSLLITLIAVGTAFPQNVFEDAIKQLSSENVKGYIQPLLDGFGANLNSGFPGSASINTGVHIRLQFIGMATVIGDAERSYKATPPEPFNQTGVETATIFGDRGTVIQGPMGMQYQFQNGQIRTDWLPFAVPQLTFGNFYGTQGMLRYIKVSEREDIPQISFFGIGARHSISQYFPLLPVDIAASIYYQSFNVGEIMEARTTAFGAQVSKSFVLVTVYGGLQYENSTVNLEYTYTGPLPPGDLSDRHVSLDLKGENNIRLITGVGFSLGILHLHGDINIGKVIVLSAGVGFGV
jgi:hypothetical protein